jgi:hypothetical protein
VNEWSQDQNPPAADEQAPQPGASSAEGTPAAGDQDVEVELRRLGETLAAAIRAAAGTPEAERLKADVRSGAQSLRRELDEALTTSREAATRASVEYRTSGLQRLRSDVAKALFAVNRSLENLASNLEPGAPTSPAGSEPPAPGAGSESEGPPEPPSDSSY